MDTEASSILEAVVSNSARRETAERSLDAGVDAILAEIDATVLPRRLVFTAGDNQLIMIAGSARLLRMVEPAIAEGDNRKATLANLASELHKHPSEIAQTFLSEHLEDEVAAEEVGFSPAEIRDALAEKPEQPEPEVETVAEGEEEADAIGVRGFYDSLDNLAVGQAYLLPEWEEIEIAGEDILPETDEEMGQLLAQTSTLRTAIRELCGENAILMGYDGTGVVSFVFSPEGEVISSLAKADPDGLVTRWRRSCQKDEG